MKDQNFLDEDWDYAIILDSARYDIFEEMYSDYFSGNLEKRKSKASATPEWADKVLEGRQNINWFSANPFINGIGLPLNEIGAVDYDKTPSKHIAHVVDLWDEIWDEKKGTVHPEDVNREFKDRIDQLGDRRTVIHYMQPHAPFVGRGKSRINEHLRKSFSKLKENGEESGKISDKISERIPDLIGRLEETETFMKLGFMSSLDRSSIFEVIRGDTREKLMEYYRENMRLALENANELAEDLDGKVIITSDHGEAFGEQGVWEHHVETHIPPLVEVPWLEVEEVK